MEYVIGFVAGILAAALMGAMAGYLLLRDKAPTVLPPVPLPAPAAAAVTILVTEPFINQQLQQLLIDKVESASTAPVMLGPIKIKPTGAEVNLLPERQARLSIRLIVTAIGINVRLRPVAEFVFILASGRIQIHVTRILLEGISIPRQWVENFITEYVAGAEQQLNHSFRQLESETGVTLAEIETSDNVLVLKFR